MLLHKEADHLYSTPSMYTHCFEFAQFHGTLQLTIH